MRIASLCPSNTDIVFALGAQHTLVGVDRWSLGDPEMAKKLRALPHDVADVGTDLRIDVDSLIALKPDMILASLSVPGMEANIAALDEHALPYIVVDSQNIAAVRRGILQVADALRVIETGQAVVAAFDADIERIRAKATAARAQRKRQGKGHLLPERVAWEWWPNPVIVAGGTSWIDDFFDILGVENAFHDLSKESSPVETEEVLRRNPDTVCACWCGTLESRMTVAKIAQRPGWDRLAAVEQRRVFLLPEKLFGRPGPTLAKGLKELYELFYGDRQPAIMRNAAGAGLPVGANDW